MGSNRFGILLIVAIAIVISLAFRQYAAAATAMLVPNSDVSSAWPTCSTTCSAMMQHVHVDEGSTANDADWIGTGTNGAGGEVLRLGLTSPTDVDVASQVVVNARLRSATLGSTADTVGFALMINGALQAVTTVTMTTTFTNYTATFNGSWNQADVNSMEVYLIRNMQGTGPGGSRDDDVQLSNIYATLTYSQPPAIEQSAYRWFGNTDTASPVTFAKAVGGTGDDKGYAIDQTTDGGYVLAGYVASYGAGGNDMFVTKYDAAGNVMFNRILGSATDDRWQSVVATADGGFAVAGFSLNIVGDIVAAKYSQDGTLMWLKKWGGNGVENIDDRAYSISTTTDGGYAIGGTTSSFSSNERAWIAKLDSSGNMSWFRTAGGTGTDYVRSVKGTADGGIVGAGYTSSFGNGSANAYIIKYSSDGTHEWASTWGGTSTDYAYGIVQAPDGGYAVTGTGNSFKAAGAANTDEVFLTKLSSTGSVEWSRTWGTDQYDYGRMVENAHGGGFVITGSGYPTGSFDGFLAKFSATGSLDWSRQIGGSGTDNGFSVVATDDGGYAQAVEVQSFGAGTYDALIAKWDNAGNIANCGSNCNSPTITTSSPSVTATFPTPSLGSGPTIVQTPSYTAGSFAPVHTSVASLSPTSINVGMSLAAQDTIATVPAEGTSFRLRLNMHASGGNLTPGNNKFKLQYAAKGAAANCAAVASGNYNDVTGTTPIRYFNNPNASSGLQVATNANDPGHSGHTLVRQQYYERGTTSFSNNTTVNAGQDGMWDFALEAYQVSGGERYCIRVVKSDGALLDTYTVLPELETSMPNILKQGAYRFYENANSSTPGIPLAANNSPATIGVDTPFRMRQLLEQESGGSPSGGKYILQAGEKVSTCSVVTYSNISANGVSDGMQATATVASSVNMGDLPNSWYLPENALTVGGDPTQTGGYSQGTSDLSERLQIKGFGYSIPSDATIEGIVAYIQTDGQGTSASREYEVYLLKDGIVTGANRSQSEELSVQFENPLLTRGSENDTWGTTWTPADINDPDFGVSFRADLYDGSLSGVAIDYIGVEVFYSFGGPGDLSFYDNTGVDDDQAISDFIDDPAGTGVTTAQTYNENSVFSTFGLGFEDAGMWDFSLTATPALLGKTYCFRTINYDGSPLDGYLYYPEITFAAGGGGGGPSLSQMLRGGQSVVDGQKSPITW